MDNRGLIFIPDISGFTRFVNETEIEHSRFIIQELLELLINANEIGLEISEIEGDAILFYKYGEAPDLDQLYKQVEKMFCEFHRHIMAYEKSRICQCAACKSAVKLTLKVITHYGEFTGYNVKNYSKLIGRDIIVAHQLLKNDIDQHEYWLVTRPLAENKTATTLPGWLNWNSSKKTTEAGEIPFQYTQLSPLKENIPARDSKEYEIPDRVKVLTVSREYAADINDVFFTAVNFNFRGQWQVGIRVADRVSHALPQVGTSHRCVLEKGEVIMYTSNYSYSPEKIVYGETDEKKKWAGYFTLEKLGEKKTLLTMDYYLRNNPFMVTMFRLMMKKKLGTALRQSLENLEKLVVRTPEAVETW
ncbi:MAG TPA: DUF2652 domain-containing protein [Chitinophagaceae bacterium]|nr:DUF2652 domain-containing protein [Chitinophagaceae bacterium]